MKVSLTLSEEQVWLIQNALLIASGHEVESLEHIQPGEYEQKKASIGAQQQIVTKYMALRRALLQWWAQTESKMDAQATNEIEQSGMDCGLEHWNRLIARIMGA